MKTHRWTVRAGAVALLLGAGALWACSSTHKGPKGPPPEYEPPEQPVPAGSAAAAPSSSTPFGGPLMDDEPPPPLPPDAQSFAPVPAAATDAGALGDAASDAPSRG